MFGIRRLADPSDPRSFSNRFRSRRFELFESLVADLPRPLRILDVGGTTRFWENRGWAGRDDIQITTVNLVAEQRRQYSNIHPMQGDATRLTEFPDGSFDIAFSNSVIEHLYTYEAQAAMAHEVVRVARAYWVQTPNFWFPMEPHFQVIGWQWMPELLRIALIRRVRCGWRGPCHDLEHARATVREVKLMTRHELARIFPGDAAILSERFLGLAKSWIVVGGFGRAHSPAVTESSRA
jgi:hypothetical protein